MVSQGFLSYDWSMLGMMPCEPDLAQPGRSTTGLATIIPPLPSWHQATRGKLISIYIAHPLIWN